MAIINVQRLPSSSRSGGGRGFILVRRAVTKDRWVRGGEDIPSRLENTGYESERAEQGDAEEKQASGGDKHISSCAELNQSSEPLTLGYATRVFYVPVSTDGR